MNEDLEQRLAAARERVRELNRHLSKDTMPAWPQAYEDQIQAERNLAVARGEPYAQVIDIGPRWDNRRPAAACDKQRLAGLHCVPGQPARP